MSFPDRTNAVWRALSLAAFLNFLASPCAASSHIEQTTVRGRFFDARAEETLTVERMTHRLELRLGETVVWAEGFPSYLSDFVGVCRDLESGRDRVFYATSSGGSDGAMTLHLLAASGASRFERVFDDLTCRPELSRYFHLPEPQPFVDDFRAVAGMVCAAGDYLDRRRRGLEIYRALAPAAERRPLELDASREVVAQVLPSRQIDGATVRTLLRMHDALGEGFARGTLAETDRWRFEQVAFYHFGASWGVVLLEDKHSGRWRSIRDLPRGDSKSFLIEMAVEAVGPRSAELDLCTVCANWPPGPDALLDLESLRLTPASARAEP